MPDQQVGQPVPLPVAPPAPVGLTPVVAALVAGLVLIVVAGFVVLAAIGAEPATFVLLIGAPILTTVVGGLLARQLHTVEARTQVIQAQTNGALTSQLDAVHEHIRLESQALRRMVTRPPHEPAGSALPRQRHSVGG